MADKIIVDGDEATFDASTFTGATITVQNGKITASAATTKVGTKAPCLEGDESSVSVGNCSYVASIFTTTPGSGTLTIKKLNGDQLTQTTMIEGKKVILKGSTYDAEFKVDSKAKLITNAGTQEDQTPTYSGKGSFTASNTIVVAA
jgi:Contractile injection system spike tip protein